MDKQKQIDEMARILTLCPRNTCVGCGMECIDYRMAKAIYNKGYRKISENAVVIPKEEYEGLKLFVEKYPSAIKETVKEILTEVGEKWDDDHNFQYKYYRWFEELCLKHGIEREI